MRYRAILISATPLILMLSSAANAGPLIIATNVSNICKVEINNAVSYASVTLNSVTNNFYGSGLYFHFTPASGGPSLSTLGSPIQRPSPTSNPLRLAIPPGSWNLIISNSAVLTTGSSQSQAYPITVPANLYTTLPNGRKICRNVIRHNRGTSRN